MGNLWQDLAYAVRTLVKRPAFTLVALLPLALGIGANSAIFSVVNSVLLRPLPYRDPQTIVQIWETRPGMRMRGGIGPGAFTLDHFRQWREANRAFEHMAAYARASFNVTGLDEPLRISGARVSPSLLPLLGVTPAVGRAFQPEEEQPGRNRVILLGHRAWRAYFGAQEVVGQILRLDGEPYTIIGVMPAGFEFPDPQTEFWTPLVLAPPRPGMVQMVPVVARLKEGVTIEQARAEADALTERLREDSSAADPMDRDVRVFLGSLHERMVAPVRPALLVLLAAVGFVLLIACANVANLLLSQAVGRETEMAVRAALGAGRLRLTSQMLAESVVLALTGGLLGLLLAYWGMRLLVTLDPGGIPRLAEVSIDVPVLIFSLAVALFSAVAAGLMPALRASNVDLLRSLRGTAGATAGGFRFLRQIQARGLFAALEAALALVLLVGAGLMIQSFALLVRVDTGYDPRDVLTLRLNLPRSSYDREERLIGFYDDLLDRVGQIEGIQSAGIANVLPLDRARFVVSLDIEGRPPANTPEEMPRADFRVVSPGYFESMGIRVLRGRIISGSDGPGAPPVVMVNRALADQYFPDEEPVGKRMELGEIVGVVADVRSFGLDSEPTPEVYVCYRQMPGQMVQEISSMSLVVRSRASTEPLALVPAIRARVEAIDPDMPVDEVRTMEGRVSESVAGPRFYAAMLGIFGGIGTLLAASGIYGVVSYSVSRRTAETGLRMALGAEMGDILKMVLTEGMAVTGLGVVLGLAGSFAAARALSGMLFGVSATDPPTHIGIAVLLGLVAFLACYVPARRACRVDPAVALRHE